MVEYKYDSWGNHAVLDANGADIASATHIGNLNPFRYRGYYYDTETGLYFLKTRYYDPEVGRFITIDDLSYADPEIIHGLNLYAYCGNNPVMYTDPTGTAKWWEWLLGAVVCVALVASAVALTVFSGGSAVAAMAPMAGLAIKCAASVLTGAAETLLGICGINMVYYNKKKIIYSLRYGGFISRKAKIIIMIPFIVLFISLLTLSVCLNIEQRGFLKDADTISVFVLTIVSMLILCIFPIANIRKSRIEKKYRLWLKDEDLFETYAKPFITSVNYCRGSKLHKFGVKFLFHNKKIIKFSQHYDNVIILYKDKPMRLLYSPRFDEVMIVEDE